MTLELAGALFLIIILLLFLMQGSQGAQSPSHPALLLPPADSNAGCLPVGTMVVLILALLTLLVFGKF
jgi:hypothetical protein